MTHQQLFIAYLGGLKLGVYRHRENAGRRLLTARRRLGGSWRHVRAGLWRHRQTKQELFVRATLAR